MSTPTPKTLSTRDIAERVRGRLVGPADLSIDAMQVLDRAQANHLTYVGSSRFANAWYASDARAALVAEGVALDADETRALIFVPSVDLAVAEVLDALAPPRRVPETGVHRSAVIDPTAQIADSVHVGPGCVVGAGTSIGADTVLHANVTVMNDCVVGDGCTLWPGVVVADRCTLGNACIVHPNVTIGGDGFGYRPAPDGSGLIKIPQIGTVQIGHDVEIGSGTCIDRGKFGATEIGDGTKIDNLCQIAHNCRIGRRVLIAGTTALAGSVTVGDGAILGGRAGAVDHITIGAGATLAACSVAAGDVPPGAVFAGFPAHDARMVKREYVAIRRLPELVKLLKKT